MNQQPQITELHQLLIEALFGQILKEANPKKK